jgi:hypothetical protein
MITISMIMATPLAGHVDTRQKETYERRMGRWVLMWWTAPAPGIEVP